MKRLLLPLLAACLLFGALAAPASAQKAEDGKNVPDVARDEVLRRGDLVQRVNGDINADENDAICAMLAPPADDSHKFFISLVTQKGCKPCDLLRAHIAEKPELKAWVNVEEYQKSWAHWQVFQSEDPLGPKWQFKDFKPSKFPCLIVSPPFSGRYGHPSTLVLVHYGYDGDAKKLAGELRAGITAYVKKFPLNAAAERERDRLLTMHEKNGGHGQQPPVTPVSPLPFPNVVPDVVVNIPPAPTPAPTPAPAPAPAPTLISLLSQLVGGLMPSGTTILIFLFVVKIGWDVYRQFAVAKGIPLLLTDEQKAELLAALQTALTQKPAA